MGRLSKLWAPIKRLAICRRCPGHCCSIEDMTVLLDKEKADRTLYRYRYRNTLTSRGYMPVLKKRKDGSCTYFDRDKKRCSIYRRRPHSCKAFFCGRDRKDDSCWQRILRAARGDRQLLPCLEEVIIEPT